MPTIEFRTDPGYTVTIKLMALGSDTVALTDAAITGQTNRTSTYLGASTGITGVHHIIGTDDNDSDSLLFDGFVNIIADGSATYRVEASYAMVIRDSPLSMPAQGTAPTTATQSEMVSWLFKALTNPEDQTASQYALYNRAGSVIDHKATVSDNGTTTTKGALVTGP